jgi:hypothetical protein
MVNFDESDEGILQRIEQQLAGKHFASNAGLIKQAAELRARLGKQIAEGCTGR